MKKLSPKSGIYASEPPGKVESAAVGKATKSQSGIILNHRTNDSGLLFRLDKLTPPKKMQEWPISQSPCGDRSAT
ncbi:hypothetical protein [uncultured Ruegeria sp.]|uniref:hypothetical protein n=1 Tax=uncultured Ruegeria sp. TaxID=259304 RepID=UPI0026316301|nr:hypothetical protein [uncultured Ruegeria sp.]